MRLAWGWNSLSRDLNDPIFWKIFAGFAVVTLGIYFLNGGTFDQLFYDTGRFIFIMALAAMLFWIGAWIKNRSF